MRIFHSVWKIRSVNIKVRQSWPKWVLCICLFILFALICVPFLFLVISGLAAVCNCGTPWTYLVWSFFKEIYWRQKETFHQKGCITCYMYIMQVRKCGLSWFLVVFHTMTYWKFGSVFIFQNLGGSVIYKDAPCARGTSIHVISPYFGRSSLYFAHFLRKSPYQNLGISFFV